jgi:hypothetical protein
MIPFRSANRHRIRVLAAIAAALLASRSDAFVLCARNGSSGVPSDGATVKVRAACKDNESLVDAGALGLTTGFTTTTVRTGNTITTNAALSTPASCAAGEVATGGGVLSSAANGGVAAVRSSQPQPDAPGATPTAWRATVENVSDTGTVTATAYVVCATTP